MEEIKDCQALMLLTREYNECDQLLTYTCRNNMIMCVAVDNINADSISNTDAKALESIRVQECFKCQYCRKDEI